MKGLILIISSIDCQVSILFYLIIVIYEEFLFPRNMDDLVDKFGFKQIPNVVFLFE